MLILECPPPVKSGCDFCPFAGRKEVRNIAHKNPERYKKILQLDNCDKTGRHLFDHALTLSHTIDDYVGNNENNNSCDSGHCFT